MCCARICLHAVLIISRGECNYPECCLFQRQYDHLMEQFLKTVKKIINEVFCFGSQKSPQLKTHTELDENFVH